MTTPPPVGEPVELCLTGRPEHIHHVAAAVARVFTLAEVPDDGQRDDNVTPGRHYRVDHCRRQRGAPATDRQNTYLTVTGVRDQVPEHVWRAAAEAAEPDTLDEHTAALIERCVRAALLADRTPPPAHQ